MEVISTHVDVDPVKYEIFLHRLWAIGEEGRLTLQKVSASPIVVQGGECVSSFYDPLGTMILSCSGHLRFSAASSGAVRKTIEWFGESPGIYDGDQFFQNDPYVATAHTYDQTVLKPIFYEGRLIAWTASSSHTADTGGLLRGGATEIYHEGIRIPGLKVVERGEFREDVFKSICDQCRDPYYVGLDLKSRIAANNVCARRFLQLVEKLGVEFVMAASQKVIRDTEQMAREKLRSLPNGTWRARQYVTVPDRKKGVKPVQILLTMTKGDDELVLDFTGTSEQQESDFNSTLPGTLAHVFGVALTNQLFWDIPWSDGKMAPVKVIVPEGTILNCRFPAACGFAPWIGRVLVSAVGECMSKMLYAAGRYDEINASWGGVWYAGGPGFFYGGHNREGIVTAQGLYDIHGVGLGAAPYRDGVDTGGHQNIPSGGISDVERIEMQYPFIYFARNHNCDGGGYGKYDGGLGSYRILTVFGSKDCTVDYKPYGGLPQGAYGLFGGYPCGTGGVRALYRSDGLPDRIRTEGRYPTSPEEIWAARWGQLYHPDGPPPRVPIPEGWIIADYVPGGGGYGDPLDRPVELVVRDVRQQRMSRAIAEKVYGVVIDPSRGHLDEASTQARRAGIRAERLRTGRPYGGKTSAWPTPPEGRWETVLPVHEYLELVTDGKERAIRCRRCGHLFCSSEQNYKLYALRRTRQFEELAEVGLPSGEPYLGVFHEYYCPGCGTQLQVDTYCPNLGDDAPIWDIAVR